MKDLQDSDSTGGLFSRRVSTPAIVAAMLRSLVLGASVVLSVAAGAQGADPNGDSDGDDVPNSGDFCPGTPGSSDNYGCPEDEEVVVVYGTLIRASTVPTGQECRTTPIAQPLATGPPTILHTTTKRTVPTRAKRQESRSKRRSRHPKTRRMRPITSTSTATNQGQHVGRRATGLDFAWG